MSETGSVGGAVESIVIKLGTDVADVQQTIDQLGELKDLTNALKSGKDSVAASPFKDLIKQGVKEFFQEEDVGLGKTGMPPAMRDAINSMVDNVRVAAAKLSQSVGLTSTQLGFVSKLLERKGTSLPEAVGLMTSTMKVSDKPEDLLQQMNLPSEFTPDVFRDMINMALRNLPIAKASGETGTVLDKISMYMSDYLGRRGGSVQEMIQETAFLRKLFDRAMEMLSGSKGREFSQELALTTRLKTAGLGSKRQLVLRKRLSNAEEKTLEEYAADLEKDDQELAIELMESFGMKRGDIVRTEDFPSIPVFADQLRDWLIHVAGDEGIMPAGGKSIIDIAKIKNLIGEKGEEYDKLKKIWQQMTESMGFTGGYPRLDVGSVSRKIDDLEKIYRTRDASELFKKIMERSQYEYVAGTSMEETAKGMVGEFGGEETFTLHSMELKTKYTPEEILQELNKRYKQGIRNILLFSEMPIGEESELAVNDWLKDNPDATATLLQSTSRPNSWLVKLVSNFMGELMKKPEAAGISGDIIKSVGSDLSNLGALSDLPRSLKVLVEKKKLTQKQVKDILDKILKALQNSADIVKNGVDEMLDDSGDDKEADE